MQRFLLSIKLDNIDRFDLDFDLVKRNQINRNQVDMLIVKDKPWDYSLLEEFQNALLIITYPYTISFSYKQKPNAKDAICLFDDWHRSHNRFASDIVLEDKENTIYTIFTSEDHQSKSARVIQEFTEFLNFIGYNFAIKTEIRNPETNTPNISAKKLEKLEEKANAIIDEEKRLDTSIHVDEERHLSEDELIVIESLKNSISHLKESKPKNNTYSNSKDFDPYSWRDRMPFKKVKDLAELDENSGNVDISGELFGIDKPRTMRNGKVMLACGLGKGKTAINLKIIENKYTSPEQIEGLKNSMFVRVKGIVELDKYTGSITVISRGVELLERTNFREDKAEEKRVELHVHTRMSVMDGVTSISEYAELASKMGHPAIAITDHGVTQGFPEAQDAAAKYNIKMLYGSELYMVNDELPFALNPCDQILRTGKYVVFDLETTGLSKRYDRITEFGAVRFEHGNVVDRIDMFIDPQIPIPQKIQDKTKITQADVNGKPTIEESIDKILGFFGDAIIVSHNITFDIGFLNEALRRMGREPIKNPAIDTLSLSRYMFPEANLHNLGALSRNLDLQIYNETEAHRADYDANILNDVWLAMLNKLTAKNRNLKHSDLAKLKTSQDMLKHLRPSHISVLVKDKEGFHDLYELVSLSHIEYLADIPKTPRRKIEEYRQHLLLGSACFNGEIFYLAHTGSKDQLVEAIKFYDYIEVQPVENYVYLINRGEFDSEDDIKKIIVDIIEASKEASVPVVATGDVHYLNPEDKLTRDVYIANLGVGKKPHPLHLRDPKLEAPNQHFRSTDEMLKCFEFLGQELAYEIVVKNTRMIADLIGEYKPIQKELHPPVIENSPQILTETCYENAKALYGDPLPDVIKERLEKELRGIIDNGYSVTYYIAHEIVKKANKAGFMVGSRGSVGSSFAAHMFGITEVNPLKPHYRCPKCKHLEFVDDPNYLSGYDLPDKKCPCCGEPMVGDGQNIPFETFLGFEADKIPDIDLNFPSDYQSRAFDSTKEIFGENNVFRAGTIETVASKTAFGYVRGYYEDKQIPLESINSQYMAYLASHVADTKRTTGQHPGGIMVLPKGLNITDFTPIQYPADDKESTWKTTHLDYRALHDALLKLDLLGHVDPLALRLMMQMTNINVKDIPLNDQKVISLFTSDEALERKGNYLKAVTGASGLPEFGTTTGQDILMGANPKSFADLVIVAGLAHGTDVWNNNARELIKNGTCTIREVIGCRDDIMTYLIKKDVPSKIAFQTMEDVRKGRKVKPEFETILKANNVPQWYIDSCNKIKYMFPKAHAVAYVTMAVRVGYFKLYYPLEFYAVWFSARCKQYDIIPMLAGKDAIIARYDELKKRGNTRGEKLSPKEKEIMTMLTVAIEMAERGYKFAKVDLYKSKAAEFIVDHENKSLICPFIVIDGLGESAAESVVEARKNGKFSSKENILKRTKLSSTNVEDLAKIGTLDGLGESDQMSLFEFGLFDSEA